MTLKSNIAKAKAIERKNKQKLLAVNPNLNEKGGIYFLLREDEQGFKYAYIGQSRESAGILTRLAQHMVGYNQHIDLSIKKHKFYSKDNPYGWRIEFLNFPDSQLDEREQHYIKQYALNGYQLRNVSLGGQSNGRCMINETKASKGYRDGILQGKKTLAKELSNIIDKHLTVSIKPEKQGNKVSARMLDKFWRLLREKED